VKVTTPRLPCFKLAAKFQRDDMIKRFLSSGFSGFYFSVIQEGEVGAGDDFHFLTGEVPSLTIADLNHLYTGHDPDVELLKRAVEVKSLPESWREHFQGRMEAAEKQHRV
jgi:MOSC domain-containing protein YiiM